MLKPSLKTRHLTWPNCYNARDLGGLPTKDGGQTCWQAVIRSDLLGRLTAVGRQALLDYGVRTIIDLRGQQEAQAELSAFTTSSVNRFDKNPNEPTYLNLPLEKDDPQVSDLLNQAATRDQVYRITLDHYPDTVTAVMRALVEAQAGGVVIHCHAGKDRTGIVVALLLRLAGVPDETIVADYAESQARLWPLYEKLVAEAGGEDNVGAWLKPIATPEMMLAMLSHLDTKYGGVHQYMLTAGLATVEINRLKARLRIVTV